MSIFKERKIYISVKEGLIGLECYSDDELRSLNKPIKALIKAFLTKICEEDLKE